MSAPSEVTYTDDGRIATITIDRPDRRNAINAEVVAGIGGGLERALDHKVKAIVLTGAGDKAFCAGGDLGGMSDASRVAQHFIRGEVGDLFKQMRSCGIPIVARVNGHALAGGFGLMLACDLVIAADDVEVGTPEINLGLWPFMISAVIQRDVPRKIALELMLTGRRMGAEEAARWGFVNRVVPRADLDQAVTDTLEVLASKSPLIVSLGKRSFYAAEDMNFDAALEYLAGMLTVCLESEDTVEGVTAFLEKRKPEWKGR
jgi:enoyl-CoA hydratase/carnithine racemase